MKFLNSNFMRSMQKMNASIPLKMIEVDQSVDSMSSMPEIMSEYNEGSANMPKK